MRSAVPRWPSGPRSWWSGWAWPSHWAWGWPRPPGWNWRGRRRLEHPVEGAQQPGDDQRGDDQQVHRPGEDEAQPVGGARESAIVGPPCAHRGGDRPEGPQEEGHQDRGNAAGTLVVGVGIVLVHHRDRGGVAHARRRVARVAAVRLAAPVRAAVLVRAIGIRPAPIGIVPIRIAGGRVVRHAASFLSPLSCCRHGPAVAAELFLPGWERLPPGGAIPSQTYGMGASRSRSAAGRARFAGPTNPPDPPPSARASRRQACASWAAIAPLG